MARTLLEEDGVIFISIDDNEYTNLKKIDIYKTFFKEHYNVKIKADLQEVFGTYGIYKLSVKEKK